MVDGLGSCTSGRRDMARTPFLGYNPQACDSGWSLQLRGTDADSNSVFVFLEYGALQLNALTLDVGEW